MPTRTQIKGAGGFPFPSQHQYAHPWHHAGKCAQLGAKLMIDNGVQPAEDWSWMQTTGYAMRCQQVPARPPVETSNRFAAMESDEPEVPDPPEPIEGTLPRAGKSAGLPSAPRPTSGTRKLPCCIRTCLDLRECGRRNDRVSNSQIAGGLPSAAPAAPSPRAQIAGGLPSAAPAHVDSGSQTIKRQYLDA